MTNLIKPKELADRFGVSLPHIYAMARSGKLPSLNIGGAVRFDPAAIDAFLESLKKNQQGE